MGSPTMGLLLALREAVSVDGDSETPPLEDPLLSYALSVGKGEGE